MSIEEMASGEICLFLQEDENGYRTSRRSAKLQAEGQKITLTFAREEINPLRLKLSKREIHQWTIKPEDLFQLVKQYGSQVK